MARFVWISVSLLPELQNLMQKDVVAMFSRIGLEDAEASRTKAVVVDKKFVVIGQ